MKKRLLSTLAGSLTLMLSASSFAGHHDSDGKEVIMNNLETGMSMGSVVVSSYDDDGVVFTPKLSGLTPGAHGFHVHQNGDCSPAMKDGKKVPSRKLLSLRKWGASSSADARKKAKAISKRNKAKKKS